MKKWTLLVALICVMLFSTIALAEEPNNDGKLIALGGAVIIDSNGYRDAQAPRYLYPADEDLGRQSAKVKLPVWAFLPCYLEFTFQGNDMNGKLQSWGAGSNVEWNGGGSLIGFYPAVGGYVNGAWEYIANSTSNYHEIEPGPGVFIRACDTYKTQIWANLPYKLTISIANNGLSLAGFATVLPVELRTSPTFTGSGDVWTERGTLTSADMLLAQADALVGTTLFSQMRVPYSKDFKAGKYTGEITFTAATL